MEQFNLADGITESFGYVYAYQYPPNSARLLRVYDRYWTGRTYGYFGNDGLFDYPNRFGGGDEGYPYRIVDSDQGPLIFTDAQEARAVYTKLDMPESRFREDFALALSYKLAYFIAPRLARGEEQMVERVRRDYLLMISEARGNSANEEEPEPRPESDLVRARI